MTARPGGAHSDPEPCTTLTLAFAPASAWVARRRLVTELVAGQVRQSVVDDAESILAELVANAIEHGVPDRQGEIEVSWCLHDDRLLISVLDSGEAPGGLHALRLSDDSLRGRGLAMVDVLCDRWNVETGRGVRVTAELDFSVPGPPTVIGATDG